jgi:CUB domain
MSKPRGVITLPTYPYNYCDGMSCLWHIQAAVGQQIQVSYLNFMVASGDLVNIYDGPDTGYVLLES